MKIKSGKEKLWNEYQEKNADFYGKGVIDFAKSWTKLLEEQFSKNSDLTTKQSIKTFADQTSQIADTNGISGFMYDAAVSILSAVWEYGDELREWHNKKYEVYDDPNVVNPAVITIV